MALVDIHDLSVDFGGALALRGISLSVERGEALASSGSQVVASP